MRASLSESKARPVVALVRSIIQRKAMSERGLAEATANVAVGAGEPNLLDLLMRGRDWPSGRVHSVGRKGPRASSIERACRPTSISCTGWVLASL